MAGIILDRFGQDVVLFPEGEDAFSVRVSVVVSPQFFAWLTGLGAAVQVQFPADVARQYQAHLKSILQGYPHD